MFNDIQSSLHSARSLLIVQWSITNGFKIKIMAFMYMQTINFMMRQGQKYCQKIVLKSEKELQGWRRRQQRQLQGVPRVILGKLESNTQQVWLEELKNQPLVRLKELSVGERGHMYARMIVSACCSLASFYGFFMINENMVFFNAQRQVFAWINPDILENHVKIYLPHSAQGEQSMIRSIISFLKLWYKCDYSQMADIKHLQEIAPRLQQAKLRGIQTFKPRSPQKQFLGARRNSVNLQGADIPQRYREEGPRMPGQGIQALMDNKSAKQICRSPQRDHDSNFLTSSMSNKYTPHLKFNQLTAETDKNHHDPQLKCINSHPNPSLPLSKSIGSRNDSTYYPNKTSNNHRIVNMINKLNSNSEEEVKNKILLDDDKMRQLEQEKIKKLKESLDGIGQQVNDLFQSNIQNEQESPVDSKEIVEQFQKLLG